jgi:hypothetical protein
MNGIELPADFWKDLADALRLVVASYRADFSAAEGEFVADRLRPFVEAVRRLLNDRSRRISLSDEGRQGLSLVLANALITLGEQTGTPAPLEEAISIYGSVLSTRTRERVPLDWAATQNNLGTALQTLGAREGGTARLDEAVSAYREASRSAPASASRLIGPGPRTTSQLRSGPSAYGKKVGTLYARHWAPRSQPGRS